MKKLTGYRKTGDKIVYDEDVYQYIKKHSRFIDRLNGRKMMHMSEIAYAIFDEAVLEPTDPNWKFFGKHAPKD